MAIFSKKLKKYNEIQLTKNKMDFYFRKMKNQPPWLIQHSSQDSKLV